MKYLIVLYRPVNVIANFLLFIPVSVAPICLNDKPEIVINERALLVGWGKLSGQNNVVSTIISINRIFYYRELRHRAQFIHGNHVRPTILLVIALAWWCAGFFFYS